MRSPPRWLFALALLGCGSSASPASPDAAALLPDSSLDSPPNPAGVLPGGLIGTWNVTTAYFTPEGGQPQINTALLGKPIALTAAGSYTFNGGAGSWSVVAIESSDWTRWSTGPYANSRKVVFVQTGGQTVDGPLEESAFGITGFKTIYHPATGPAGLTEIDFGRSKR